MVVLVPCHLPLSRPGRTRQNGNRGRRHNHFAARSPPVLCDRSSEEVQAAPTLYHSRQEDSTPPCRTPPVSEEVIHMATDPVTGRTLPEGFVLVSPIAN